MVESVPGWGTPAVHLAISELFPGQEDVKKSILKFAVNSALKKSLQDAV